MPNILFTADIHIGLKSYSQQLSSGLYSEEENVRIALNNIYARYLCSLFKLGENQFPLVLFGTTFISFLISLLDFKGIAAFLAPVLEISYPGIIILTILSIFTRKWRTLKIYSFYGVSGLMLLKLL